MHSNMPQPGIHFSLQSSASLTFSGQRISVLLQWPLIRPPHTPKPVAPPPDDDCSCDGSNASDDDANETANKLTANPDALCNTPPPEKTVLPKVALLNHITKQKPTRHNVEARRMLMQFLKKQQDA